MRGPPFFITRPPSPYTLRFGPAKIGTFSHRYTHEVDPRRTKPSRNHAIDRHLEEALLFVVGTTAAIGPPRQIAGKAQEYSIVVFDNFFVWWQHIATSQQNQSQNQKECKQE